MQKQVRDWMIRIASLNLGMIALIYLKYEDPNKSTYAIYLGLLVVSLFPWILALRRKISKRPFSKSGKWMTTAKVFLWITLLIGPVVTGISWLWFIVTMESGSMARSWGGLGVFLYAVLSLSSAYYFAAFAYAIQLWRDQWYPRLNLVAAIFLILVFLSYCWMMYDRG